MIARAGHMLMMIALILMSVRMQAQSFNPNYNFKHLNVQNGLTQNIVYHFLQDSRGYMWVGTHNGLSLYDGIKVINFVHDDQNSKSIARNFISGIAEDSSGQVWASNENGIERYNRSDNSFSHFGVDKPDGRKNYTYCQLLGFASANELWFLETEERTINFLDTKTGKTTFISGLDATNAQFYKASGQTIHIWSSYDKGTIHQVYKNKKLIKEQAYFSGKGEGINAPGLVISHVFQQNDSVVWLSANEGLVKLNPLNNEYRVYNKWRNQDVNEIRYVTFSPSGQLWVATGGTGIYAFDVATTQFIYNFRNNKLDAFSICSDNIVSLYFDRVGNIWCGSYGNGSSYAHTENLFFENHLSKADVQSWKSNSNNISWLDLDPNNDLWCILSEASGFWKFDKEFRLKMHKMPLLENRAPFDGYLKKFLFDNNNNIWCGTNKGLYKYSIATNIMRPVHYEFLSDEVQGSRWIKGMIWLNDSSMVFSTYAGLYHVTNLSGNPVIKPINFLQPGAYIGFETLFQDKNSLIYIKSINDSLYVLKPIDNGKDYVLFKSLHLMPDVNSYFSEKGDSIIYIATNFGLYRINNNNFHLARETCDDKLLLRDIRSVFKKDNKLWIFGEKGLYVFDEKSRQGRTYTVEDGLPSNEFSFSSLVFKADQCVVGTANGLVSFFPGRLQGTVYPPGAQLTGIYINDILHAATPNSNEMKKINLSFRQNTFSFDFSTIAFQHISDCSFEYKLDGYDDDWIEGGAAHYTRYSKIPPGGYTFNIRVIDPLGKVSPFTKTLEIQIAKAYWQTNLFRACVLLVIAAIGWLLLRWYFTFKIRKQKREFERQQLIEKERTRIATDMHDDLGAGLSRIRFLSQSILNKKLGDETVSAELKKITSFSDEMSEKMGEIVWALNERNDTLADLVAYTRSYAMEYLANHNIECEANTPMHLPGTFITGEMRRDIFLSVKECLHNIVKHAGATKVCFSVELKEMMKIVVHDNGKGIDWNDQRAFSNGIQNIKKRMKEINGEVVFLNDHGTKVTLTIPFVL